MREGRTESALSVDDRKEGLPLGHEIPASQKFFRISSLFTFVSVVRLDSGAASGASPARASCPWPSNRRSARA